MDMRQITRRRFLELSVVGATGLAATGVVRASTAGGQSEPTPASPMSTKRLERFAESIVSGGPPKDGIPAIDDPRFVPAEDMDYLLKPEDRVFVLHYRQEVRVYPQLVLVWHEIVNDRVAGEQLSVTYCPLTGSAIAFKGRAPDGAPLTFGTSGKLVNSNLLMYDRQTDSQWPQMLGQAITGSLGGTILEEIPLSWTTWERWKAQGVSAPVLSAQTGHLRGYGEDPYGAYAGSNQGYYGNADLIFPVLDENDRFEPKEVVIGVKVGEDRLAIPKEAALQKDAWNLTLANQPLVALRDPALESVGVFSRQLGNQTFSFEGRDGDSLQDQDGGVWHQVGPVLEGPGGERLPSATFYDAMWFAWYAFFPHTQIA